MYNTGRPAVTPSAQFSAPPRTQSAPPTSQQVPQPGRGPGAQPMRNVDSAQSYQPYGPPMYGQPGYPYGQPDPSGIPPYPYQQHVPPPHHHYPPHYPHMYPGYALPPAAAPPYASPPQQGPQAGISGRGAVAASPQQPKASKAIPIVDPTAAGKSTSSMQHPQAPMAPHHMHQHQHMHHYAPHMHPHMQPHPMQQSHLHMHAHSQHMQHYHQHQGHPQALAHHHPGNLQHHRPPPMLDDEMYPKGPQSSWNAEAAAMKVPGVGTPGQTHSPQGEMEVGQEEGVGAEMMGAAEVGVDAGYDMVPEPAARNLQMMRNMNMQQGMKGTPEEAMELYQGAPGSKKMYSVEFLLRFQHDQTEPPEKIKLFSEIYMPTGVNDNGVPLPQQRGQRAGAIRAKKGAPPVQMAERNDFTAPTRRVSDPFKAYRPQDETQVIVKKVNGILNKITPEKYEALMQSMLELNFDVSNQDLLNKIIACVFERAVQHHLFCNLYADVCRDLTQKFAQTHSKKDGEEANRAAYASFRRALLNKCQTEFEAPPAVPEGIPPEEKAEYEKKLRARQLGNIKFIGELFKRKMLTEKIMHEVIKRLLLGSPPQETHQPSDEEIEVLCKLLKTVGQQLDRPQAAAYMDHYFIRIKALQQSHPRSRIRFMLQDTIDLRSENWIPRREEQKAQTLAELEMQMAKREREKHEALMQAKPPPVFPGKGGKGGVPPALGKGKGGKGDDFPSPPQAQRMGAPRGLMNPHHHAMPAAYGTGRGALMGGEPNSGGPGWPAGPVPVEGGNRAAVSPTSPLVPMNTPAGKGGKRKQSISQKEPLAEDKVAEGDRSPEPPVDDAEIEQAAISMIEEFKNSMNEGDVAGLVVENFRLVGEANHKHLLNKAIQHATSSFAKHAHTRELLAEILMHLICEPDKESKAKDYIVSMESIFAGFCLFFEDAIELGRLEDNPRLWDCFAHLAVCCLQSEAFTFSDLNFCIPDSFVEGEEVFACFLAIFNRLKVEPNAIDLTCTGHFDALQKLFCTDKTAGRIDRFLKLLQDNNLLEVDPSIYIYYAFKVEMNSDQLLQWLQDTIPETVAFSETVTLKVAAPTILYSCVASNVFVDTQEPRDPRVLFQKFLELFNKQLIKPILKYTQNANPRDKLNNELQCLLEARRFCCITNFQSGVLCNFFQVFYELEIVTEDAYYMWRERDSRWGTDLALKEVQSFLSFLENGDAELGDEDEVQADGQ